MKELIYEIQNYNHQLISELENLKARELAYEINWSDRLIGIVGQKGVGKTTLLLQKLKELNEGEGQHLYLSLDHPSFTSISLIDFVKTFNQINGKTLLLDEVHKYPDWSSQIKSIYDTYKKIKIIYSGSSALHLLAAKSDLSRRSTMYNMPILSFREFLQLETGNTYKKLDLRELITEHEKIARSIIKDIKPLAYLTSYFEHGVYPFYRENPRGIMGKLLNVVNHTLENDLVFVNGLDPRYSAKLRTLLGLISESVPFAPKITKLSETIGLSRPTVSQYLEYLQAANLIHLVMSRGRGYQKLIKPEKIYLDNTNLIYALSLSRPNVGTLRETFVISHLKNSTKLVEIPEKGDFVVNNKYVFEVGGKKKDAKQISTSKDSYLILDDIELGYGNKIPLWLVGFLF